MPNSLDENASLQSSTHLLPTRRAAHPVYGRRRVGKATLLLSRAEQASRPFIYWVANRDTPRHLATLDRDLGGACWQSARLFQKNIGYGLKFASATAFRTLRSRWRENEA